MAHHIFTYCPGCDGKSDDKKLSIDHVHQYIGGTGNTVMVTFIDGQAFTFHDDAISHLKMFLECTDQEAQDYIRSLTRTYN